MVFLAQGRYVMKHALAARRLMWIGEEAFEVVLAITILVAWPKTREVSQIVRMPTMINYLTKTRAALKVARELTMIKVVPVITSIEDWPKMKGVLPVARQLVMINYLT